ncbi:MAG: methyltransferase domain-containing protein [Acidimicrobiaceae bacterium]|nr:methyltransferase domain-containing protein [Acidimicrobiaceae bacterium]
MSAVERWDAGIAASSPPEWILREAPENPLAYPPTLFRAANGRVPASATERLARGGLGLDKTVLDVGSGGGGASMALASHARMMVGVDLSTGMLANFAEAAESAGVAHREIVGRWPDVAHRVPRCEVVLCRNVVYMVTDIGPFVSALAERASRRVVVELRSEHPGRALAPLWKEFWGHESPDGPASDDFTEVVRELGFDPTVRTEPRLGGLPGVSRAQYVQFVRRRLCLTADRDPEIDAALGPELPAAVAVTVAWDPPQSQ